MNDVDEREIARLEQVEHGTLAARLVDAQEGIRGEADVVVAIDNVDAEQWILKRLQIAKGQVVHDMNSRKEVARLQVVENHRQRRLTQSEDYQSV